MAIIRNERAQRPDPEPEALAEPEVEEIDYRWHPTEDEFVSPLTAQQWAELLGDPTFAETDAANAVRCLRDYGEPATFQQLSIRYRGTMGRYRRWLSEAAQAAGKRFGVAAPQQDQFGMDEWWPLLYVMRATGKPGAGVFEMMLRDEVDEAYRLIDEKEKQAKRAENARQLQRIEQLERARREERERRAAAAAVQPQAPETPAEPEPAPAPKPAPQPAPAKVRTVEQVVGHTASEPAAHAPVTEPSGRSKSPSTTHPALDEYLATTAALEISIDRPPSFDVSGPIDYALRYADRLRSVLALMREGYPRLTAAAAAREIGDNTVEHLQDVLNGQEIPDFAYLEDVKAALFVNPEYLEAADGMESYVPAFMSYAELLDSWGEKADLAEDAPQEIVYVSNRSKKTQAVAVLRFSPLRCALLSRTIVPDKVRSELGGIAHTSMTVGAADWEKLVSGKIWPGSVL